MARRTVGACDLQRLRPSAGGLVATRRAASDPDSAGFLKRGLTIAVEQTDAFLGTRQYLMSKPARAVPGLFCRFRFGIAWGGRVSGGHCRGSP
jgi:hypothetical protein